MLKLKIALAAVIFMFPIINYGQHTDQINSNRVKLCLLLQLENQ
jgi:hypothetical protein